MTLQLDLEPGAADAVVVTDEDAIDQILFNLADNAAKYACGAADKAVHVAARRAGNRVQIEVLDRGPGVAAAFRQRIFAPFDRGAVPTGSNDMPGVGLGLALARGLARDLGGELVLVEVAGGGACFRLELPAA
jgi:two-component system sensor histidine kinase KdpD